MCPQALYNRLVPLSGGERKFSPIQLNRLKVRDRVTVLQVFNLTRSPGPTCVFPKCFCVYLETGHRKNWPLCSDWRRNHPLFPPGYRPELRHVAERWIPKCLHSITRSKGQSFTGRGLKCSCGLLCLHVVLDTNDRFLRKITIGQSPTEKGYTREVKGQHPQSCFFTYLKHLSLIRDNKNCS